MACDPKYERLLAQGYDAVNAEVRDASGDIAFYVAEAKSRGGPVLELGCGTGRTLLPVAAEGIACVGVDVSPEMLAVFRARKPPKHVELVEARMEDFDLGGRRFPLVTCPFRAFQHLLDVPSQLAALANVRRHLAPGGAFVFDVFDPKLIRIAQRDEPEREGVRFMHEGKPMRRHERVQRDPATQVMIVTFRFEGDAEELCGTTELQLRWFYRYELEHLLVRAGFTRLQFFGDFDRSPWETERETIVIARE